jgi:hypothetical protein
MYHGVVWLMKFISRRMPTASTMNTNFFQCFSRYVTEKYSKHAVSKLPIPETSMTFSRGHKMAEKNSGKLNSSINNVKYATQNIH